MSGNFSSMAAWGPAKGTGPGSMKGGLPGPYSGGPGGPGGPGPGPLGMAPAELNEDGLPIRPGKDECLLYKNTGSCKNGIDCIFHHPQKSDQGKGGMMPIMPPMSGAPPGLSGPPPGMSGPPGMSDAPPGMSSSAPPIADGPPQVILPPEGASNNTESKDGNKVEEKGEEEKKEAKGEEVPQEPQEVQYNEEGLPIRPNMQKCGFYMRSGKCNWGPTCRFDHPAGLGGLLTGQTGFGTYQGMIGGPMTEGGLAMRPGREQCPFLKRTKTCPFGPECRFDHSMNPSAEADSKDAPPAAPKAAVTPPVSRKKEKGLGGVRGRRQVPMWRGKP